jgi:hypothetical protein
MFGTVMGGVLACAAMPTAALAGGAAAAPIQKASASGFTVIAVITTDLRWLEKWSKPGAPNFQEVGTLKVGDKATLALLFSDAQLRNGRALLQCDVTIVDESDGSVKKSPPHVCFDANAKAPPHTLIPTLLEINFTVAPADKPGLLRFQIGVTDQNRHVRVPVSVSVNVDPMGGSK